MIISATDARFLAQFQEDPGRACSSFPGGPNCELGQRKVSAGAVTDRKPRLSRIWTNQLRGRDEHETVRVFELPEDV